MSYPHEVLSKLQIYEQRDECYLKPVCFLVVFHAAVDNQDTYYNVGLGFSKHEEETFYLRNQKSY